MEFKPENPRADLRYTSKVKDLKDVVYTGDLSIKENREIFVKVLSNYIEEDGENIT